MFGDDGGSVLYPNSDQFLFFRSELCSEQTTTTASLHFRRPSTGRMEVCAPH